MGQDVFINLLLGAIAAMASALAYLYKSDRDDKNRLIQRLLDQADRTAEAQERQANISEKAADAIVQRRPR